MAILNESETGLAVAEPCRKHGIIAATYCAWKSKYSGVSGSERTRMRELEEGSATLKRMCAESALASSRSAA